VKDHSWPGADVNPYGAVKDSAALTAGYIANTAVLRDQGAPYGLSGSIYTQITDVEGEQNGFFTYDRQVEKVDEAAVRKVNLETIAAGAKAPPKPPAGTPGLAGVGAWNFDETTGTTAADSAGTHPLAVQGGAQRVPGVSGNALLFNGSTGFAGSDGTVIKTGGTNYSVAASVKFTGVGGAFQTIVGEDGDQNSAFFLQWSGADRKLAFSFAGVRALASDVTVQPGVWYHVVGVRDITASTLTIYVNGVKAGQASVLGNADVATGPLTVGRGKFGGNPVDYLNGAADNVRAYDRALTSEEVAQLYASSH
jgi:concanavalin A-like lectin/glucanase superfamily protein